MKKSLLTALVFGMMLCPFQAMSETEDAYVYDDQGKRDPFMRLVSPSGAILSLDNDLLVTDMVLEGIIQDPSGKNLAIINSLVVGVDDKIGTFTISDVGIDRVVLIKGEESFVLKLKREE